MSSGCLAWLQSLPSRGSDWDGWNVFLKIARKQGDGEVIVVGDGELHLLQPRKIMLTGREEQSTQLYVPVVLVSNMPADLFTKISVPFFLNTQLDCVSSFPC